MNTRGTPDNLVAAHPENANASKHGIYSRAGRLLSARASEIADAVMSAPQVRSPDEFGAAEIGRLLALIEAMDDEIDTNGLTRWGDARSLVKLRLQASRRLEEWLDRYAMTPRRPRTGTAARGTPSHLSAAADPPGSVAGPPITFTR